MAESKISDAAILFNQLIPHIFNILLSIFNKTPCSGVIHASAILMNILPEHLYVAIR